jgi:hypothetical protein
MVERVSPSQPAKPVKAAATAPTQARRRPVPRHPGIYYRPRKDGKVAPPYEFCYLDSTGKRRWEVVHGNLEVAEARRAELRLRRRRGERIEPCRQTFQDDHRHPAPALNHPRPSRPQRPHPDQPHDAA